MEKDIINFMDKIEIINKDLSRYVDEEKGIIFSLNTIQLLPRLDYMELDKTQFETQKFEGKINKLEYNIIEVDRPVPKNTITKKDEDIYTIVNSKVKVRLVWNVSNAIGVYKSFTNKDEAMEYAENIKKDIIKYFE